MRVVEVGAVIEFVEAARDEFALADAISGAHVRVGAHAGNFCAVRHPAAPA